MSVYKQLEKLMIDGLYEEIKERIVPATAQLRSVAPPHRDVAENTYIYLSDKSNEEQAVLVLRSDSKDPDVLQTAGGNKIGRPAGARTGTSSIKGPYKNGVDLANVTNGARVRKSHRSAPSKRKTPLATHGWWEKGVDKAWGTINR